MDGGEDVTLDASRLSRDYTYVIELKSMRPAVRTSWPRQWLTSRRERRMMNPVINLIRAFDRHWASELLAKPNVEVASSLPFVEHEG